MANEWYQQLEERRQRGKKAAELVAHYKLHLTEAVSRAWYEEQWTETVVNWTAVADLLDKVSPGWDVIELPDNSVNGWYAAIADAKHAARKAENTWLVEKLDEIHKYLIGSEGLAGKIAYQLTKRMVIDMPTARAAVDAALEKRGK